MDTVETWKVAVVAVIGALTGLWGWIGWLVIGWVICMVVDYITGSAAAAKEGEWSSAKAREGIWHKAGMTVVVLAETLSITENRANLAQLSSHILGNKSIAIYSHHVI